MPYPRRDIHSPNATIFAGAACVKPTARLHHGAVGRFRLGGITAEHPAGGIPGLRRRADAAHRAGDRRAGHRSGSGRVLHSGRSDPLRQQMIRPPVLGDPEYRDAAGGFRRLALPLILIPDLSGRSERLGNLHHPGCVHRRVARHPEGSSGMGTAQPLRETLGAVSLCQQVGAQRHGGVKHIHRDAHTGPAIIVGFAEWISRRGYGIMLPAPNKSERKDHT